MRQRVDHISESTCTHLALTPGLTRARATEPSPPPLWDAVAPHAPHALCVRLISACNFVCNTSIPVCRLVLSAMRSPCARKWSTVLCVLSADVAMRAITHARALVRTVSACGPLMVRVCVYRESETVRCPLSPLSVFKHMRIYAFVQLQRNVCVTQVNTLFESTNPAKKWPTLADCSPSAPIVIMSFWPSSCPGTYMCYFCLVHNNYSIRSVVRVDACVYSEQMFTHTHTHWLPFE